MVRRGVIFDVDGTLVDSNDAHAHAWLDAFGEAGVPVEYEQLRSRIGMGGDQLMPAVSKLSPDDPRGRAIERRRGEILRERYLPHIRPFPAAREVVMRARDAGYVIGIASSAKTEELNALLRIANVADLIDAESGAGDVERSKPEPDVVVAALKRLQLEAHNAWMIGDTPYDIEAASRARVRSIAFRSGGHGNLALAGAIAVYDGPGDLVAHWTESPLAHEEALDLR